MDQLEAIQKFKALFDLGALFDEEFVSAKEEILLKIYWKYTKE